MGVSLPGDNGPLVLPPSLAPQQLPGTVPVTNTSTYNERTGAWDGGREATAPPPDAAAAAPPPAPVTDAATSAASNVKPAGLTYEEVARLGEKSPPAASPKNGAPKVLSYEDVANLPDESPTGKAAGLDPNKKHGYVANVGAGATESVTGLLGAPVDLVAGLINLPIRATNYVAGAEIPTMDNPVGGQHWWNNVFGFIGANPENVEPATKGEEYARAAARGATAVALPGGIAKGVAAATLPGRAAAPAVETLAHGLTKTGVGAGAAGAVTGQQLGDWVPEEWRSVADTVGNVLGAMTVGGATGVAQAGTRSVVNAGRTLLPGRARPVIDPATNQPFYKAGTVNEATGVGEPIMVTPQAQRQAAGLVSDAMGQTPAEAARTIEQAQGQQPAVPGYQGTAGQITGSTGLLGLERSLQGTERGRVVLGDQAAANQRAFMDAVTGGAAPEQVQQAAGNFFRDLQAQERARIEAEARGLQSDAQTKLGATGADQDFSGDASQAHGATARGQLEDIRQPIKDRFGAAYNAIEKGDPNLALDTSPIVEARKTILDELGKAGQLTANEQRVMDAARDFGGVNKFTDLRSFQKAVAEQLREVGRNPTYGPESPPYRRLSILMDSVDRSMVEAADRYVAAKPENAGHILKDFGEGGGGASGGEANRSVPPGEVPGRAMGAGGQPPGAVAPGEPAGQPGVAGNRPVAPVASTGGGVGAPGEGVTPPAFYGGGRKPPSLFDRIIEKGGIKQDDPDIGDVKGMDIADVNHRKGGRLLTKNGLPLDKMREALAQGGENYLSPQSDVNDFLELMRKESHGQKVYPQHYEAEVRAQTALDNERRITEAARGQASDEVEGARLDRGLRMTNEEHQHAVDLMMQTDEHGRPAMHVDEAIDQAMAASDAKTLDRAAQREGMGPPGVGPGATQQDMHIAGASKLVENIKPEDVQTIKEINAGYREYKNDWRTGAIGKVLAKMSGGVFKIGDSQVPGQIFPKGPKGAEAADQLIKVAGGVDKATQILGDIPAKAFRDMALKDGVVTEAGFQKFQAAYGPVLAKFPELAAKFADARAAQATVEDAAARNAANLRALENSAAKAYLGGGPEGATPLKAIQSIMGSKNAPAQFRELMQKAQGNVPATEGIRQNFLDWIAKQAGSSTEQEAGRPTTFINSSFKNLLKNPDYRAAAKVVLAPDQYRMLFKVGDAMDQVGSSANKIKIPGSPGTFADVHSVFGRLLGGSLSGGLVRLAVGEELVPMAAEMVMHGAGGGWLGSAARAGGIGLGFAWNAAKANGIRNAEDLALEMVHKPTFGTVMLRTAPTNPDSPIWRDIARKMMATGAGLATGDRQQ